MSARRAALSLAVAGACLVPGAPRRLVAAENVALLAVLEVEPGTPGSVEQGAPPRFVLTKDGAVYVGGTSQVRVGRLEKSELAALRKRIDTARKTLERGGVAQAAQGARRVRLRLGDEDPREAALDPESAVEPLGSLVRELLHFDHPSLARFVPASYALGVREGRLAGGCRGWTFALPLERALEGTATVTAGDAASWPKGAMPASVCVGERRYVVTLRPLLPHEQR